MSSHEAGAVAKWTASLRDIGFLEEPTRPADHPVFYRPTKDDRGRQEEGQPTEAAQASEAEAHPAGQADSDTAREADPPAGQVVGDEAASRPEAEAPSAPEPAGQAPAHPAEARPAATCPATWKEIAAEPWPLLPRLLVILIAVDLLATGLGL